MQLSECILYVILLLVITQKLVQKDKKREEKIIIMFLKSVRTMLAILSIGVNITLLLSELNYKCSDT